jgi:hypothetical protein
MPCPPRTSHGRHAAAGSRSSSSQALVQLPSTRPIPRGAVQVTHAVAARYIVLWRVIRVVDRSRARHRLSCNVLSAGAGWTLRARLALTRGSALTTGGQIYFAFLPCCASDQGFCPDDQYCLLRSACRISRTRAPDTAASARGLAEIPVCLPGGYLLLKGPASRRHISCGFRAWTCVRHPVAIDRPLSQSLPC